MDLDLHQMKWKNEITRCKAATSSGKRCKIDTNVGNYLCEHHKQDLIHYVKDPSYVVGLTKSRYPKRHHPACDRKGQNDCSCHTFSTGALSVMALKQAIEKSQELSPLYRKKRKLEHQLKVKKIRAYYNSITEAELWMPKDSGFRQFRFFIWDDKRERIIVRVIKDNFRHKSTLLKWLRKLAPLHVYYTTTAWLNPQGIGPDPTGKHGKAKMKKKGWCLERYHNTMLYQGLYFDVDYDNADYNEGVNMLMELDKQLTEMLPRLATKRYGVNCQHIVADGLNLDDKTFVFSGSKGFHLVYEDWQSGRLTGNCKVRYENQHVNNRHKMNRVGKGSIVNTLKKNPKLLLDWEVTVDTRRIIRVPGTVHGKTLRVCRVVDPSEITLDSTTGRYTYNADNPIG
jgi:DNA primase catalytic subunit